MLPQFVFKQDGIGLDQENFTVFVTSKRQRPTMRSTRQGYGSSNSSSDNVPDCGWSFDQPCLIKVTAEHHTDGDMDTNGRKVGMNPSPSAYPWWLAVHFRILSDWDARIGADIDVAHTSGTQNIAPVLSCSCRNQPP